MIIFYLLFSYILPAAIIISPSSNPSIKLNSSLEFGVNDKDNSFFEYSLIHEGGMYYSTISTPKGYIVSENENIAASSENNKNNFWNIVPLSNSRFLLQSSDNKCWSLNNNKVDLEDCPKLEDEIPFSMMFNITIFPSEQENNRCKNLLEKN